jgi:uncharacterized membrane protein
MKKKSEHRIFVFVLAALVAGLTSCSRPPRYEAAPISGNEVIIDISSLATEVPRFFSYPSGGRNVNFFVIRMNNGIQSFLDACVTCYPKKLGYRHEDGHVTCRACNMSFSIYKLEQGMGGCYPIKLEGRADKGAYRIAIATLEKMADKF